LQPTALVHEAWLRLQEAEPGKWNNREHFFRTAAIVMPQILVDADGSSGTPRRELDLPDRR
jgi:hypothetical protein